MSESLLHGLTLIGAFWTALLVYAAKGGEPRYAGRFVGGLALGALATHLGWALLHPRALMLQPLLLLDPGSGYTVLALPVGFLATVPWRAREKHRVHYLATAFGALPLALAVARVGCWFSACCHGTATELPWGVVVPGVARPVHPVPLYEALAWIAFFFVLPRLHRTWVGPGVLIVFGALRLALEPLRAAAALGPPAIQPAWIALVWLATGLLLSPVAREFLGSRGGPERSTPSGCRTPPPLSRRTLSTRSPPAARTPSAS